MNAPQRSSAMDTVQARHRPPRPLTGGDLELRPFDRRIAHVVASWVADDRELFWLAPTTVPPLTPVKVIGWTKPNDRAFMMVRRGESSPLGYAELNPLHTGHDRMWIGHVIVSPEHRGRGVGTELMRQLLAHAGLDERVQTINMIVFPDNLVAMRCYRRCGFRDVAWEEHRFRPTGPNCRMIRLEITRDAFLIDES